MMTKKHIINFISILFLMLAVSCKQSFSDYSDYSHNKKSDIYITTRFCVNDIDYSSRMIVPSPLNVQNDFIEQYILSGTCKDAPKTIDEKYTKINETFTKSTNKSAWESFSNYAPKLYPGKWSFKLEVKIKDFETPVFQSEIDDFELSKEQKTVKLELSEIENIGTGSFEFKFTFPENSFSSVTYDFGQNNTPVWEQIKISPEEISNNSFTIQQSSCLHGVYYIRVYFYSDESETKKISQKTIFFRVVTGCTTKDEIILKELNTPYSITYETNGVSFTPDLTDFNSSMNITLPTSGFTLNLGTTDAYFQGWYTDKELTKKIEKWNAGEYSQDVTVYAKWTYSKVYLDPENGDDDNSGASPDKAVKSFEKAKSLLEPLFSVADSGTYVCSTITLSKKEDFDNFIFNDNTSKQLFRYGIEFKDPLVKVESDFDYTLNKMLLVENTTVPDDSISLQVTKGNITLDHWRFHTAKIDEDAFLLISGIENLPENVTLYFADYDYDSQKNIIESSEELDPNIINKFIIYVNGEQKSLKLTEDKKSAFIEKELIFTNADDLTTYLQSLEQGSECTVKVKVDSSNLSAIDNAISNNTGKIKVNLDLSPCTDINAINFKNNQYLSGIILPDGLNAIAFEAFQDCTNLISVTIPTSVSGIYKSAFNGCKKLTSVTIPSSVTTISDSAFKYCTGLTSVEIPTSVTTISGSAFYNCTGLTSVEIPSSVTTIGDSAFCNCTGLTSVEIPTSVTTIGTSAFRNCTGLTSVEIPSSVTTIGKYAFYDCKSLKKVNITDLTSWCNITFEDSGSNPLREAQSLYLNDEKITSLHIPDSLTSIKQYAFYNCSDLTSIEIPSTVKYIGGSAFYDCSNLTSITIPSSVISIGSDAFFGCNKLESIKVEEENSKYDSRNNCNAIIETNTNKLIKGCKNTVIPQDVTSICDRAFYGCSALTSITIPSSVTSIGDYAFYNCIGLTSVEIPTSVTSIGDSAFHNTGLTSVEIPSSIISIGENVFGFCKNLKSVTIPTSVTSIGKSAFCYCSSLESVSIPSGVTTISDSTFTNCNNLTTVTIPSSVTSIEKYAFQYCKNFTTINFTGTEEQWNKITKGISAISGNVTINYNYVPTFATAPDLKTYLSSLSENTADTSYPIKINVTSDEEMSDITDEIKKCYNRYLSLDFSGSTGVTKIDDGAFSGCERLTSVTIPESVTSIGVSAFTGCSGLASIEIPESVTSIGNNAFYNCSGLTSVTIPSSVTSIGELAFYNCTGLTSVTIPSSVTSIGEYAFDNTGLATINYTGTQSQWDNLMKDNANTGIPSGVTVNCKTTIPEGYTPMSSFDTSNPQPKYAMSSFDDLQSLQNIVNDGYGCANTEIYLCDDITIPKETPWTPIGTNVSGDPKYFYGTFDGNGHTIKISQIDTSGNPQDGKALFGAVYNATIKNITVEGNITTVGGDASSNYAGIVGYAESNDSNKTIIENCISNVTISGSGKVENVGGIVACAKGSEIKVINCINNGSLLDNNTSASKVGGIIGYSECTNCIIKNCANNGNISTKDNCAGFVGYCTSTNLTIMNCANFGKLKANDTSVAGFANYNNSFSSVFVSYSYYSDQDGDIGALTSFNGTTVSYQEDPYNVYGYNSDTDKTVDFINSNTNNLTINGVTYNTSNIITVLDALNAWIEWSEGGNDPTHVTYKKWKYDTNGKLAFE